MSQGKILDEGLLAKIDTIDCKPIQFFMTEFNDGPLINRIQFRRRWELYKKFLYIKIVHTDFKAVPTTIIDEVWHCHILMTDKYRTDCALLCNRFIEHDPLFGTRDPDEVIYYYYCRTMTIDLFKSNFGLTISELNCDFDN